MCTIAKARLEESRTLLNAESLMLAAVVFSFAVEEFGKAILLRTAYDSGADPARIDGFYDHSAKIKAATSRIGDAHLQLGPVGKANLQARLAGLYADWKGEWRYGIHVDRATIERSVEGLGRALEQARIEWSYGPTPYTAA